MRSIYPWKILSSVWNIEKVMWGQAGDLHFNTPEITIQRGDSGQMSRKRPKSLHKRKITNKQKIERERYILGKPNRLQERSENGVKNRSGKPKSRRYAGNGLGIKCSVGRGKTEHCTSCWRSQQLAGIDLRIQWPKSKCKMKERDLALYSPCRLFLFQFRSLHCIHTSKLAWFPSPDSLELIDTAASNNYFSVL